MNYLLVQLHRVACIFVRQVAGNHLANKDAQTPNIGLKGIPVSLDNLWRSVAYRPTISVGALPIRQMFCETEIDQFKVAIV